jgi:hypothetical protein
MAHGTSRSVAMVAVASVVAVVADVVVDELGVVALALGGVVRSGAVTVVPSPESSAPEHPLTSMTAAIPATTAVFPAEVRHGQSGARGIPHCA